MKTLLTLALAIALVLMLAGLVASAFILSTWVIAIGCVFVSLAVYATLDMLELIWKLPEA